MRSRLPVGHYAALGEMLLPKDLRPYPPDGGMAYSKWKFELLYDWELRCSRQG